MSTNGTRLAFVFFHISLALVVFIESVITAYHAAHSPTQSHLATILPWFAGIEALAALLLLIPKTIKPGGAVLLIIFATSIVVHGPAEQMALFVYAAGVVFVMVNGSAFSRGAVRSDRGKAPED